MERRSRRSTMRAERQRAERAERERDSARALLLELMKAPLVAALGKATDRAERAQATHEALQVRAGALLQALLAAPERLTADQRAAAEALLPLLPPSAKGGADA